MQPILIESLDQEGRGVGHADGKVIFVEGALPGELVTYSSYRKKPKFELAVLDHVLKPSAMRTVPRCSFFGKCGGCSLQHLDPRAQVALKQRVLEDSLRHLGKVVPELTLPAIHGPDWGYRHRARLAVRYVPKKGGVLVGFHEKRSSYVADMTSCEILPPHVSALIEPLRQVLAEVSIRDRIPQIEVAVAENATVLVLRVLEPLSERDRSLLHGFGERHGVRLYVQPRGPDSAHPLSPEDATDLCYALPEFDLKLRFGPTDFIQVNRAVNRVLVRRALSLLDPAPGERIADLFSGVGNFALAIARRGATVLGLEGNWKLVARAAANAAANGLGHAAEFRTSDLFRLDETEVKSWGRFDRMLIDPPRDGAAEVVKSLGEDAPHRIVYVSCNPATLARDAAILVHVRGYRLSAAGVLNMFPHTSHVESVAVFDRRN